MGQQPSPINYRLVRALPGIHHGDQDPVAPNTQQWNITAGVYRLGLLGEVGPSPNPSYPDLSSKPLTVSEYLQQLRQHVRFVMPLADGGQEQLQNREEIWELFPEDWANAPEWCTLTPTESLKEWAQVLSDVHDIEQDLVLQWCDMVADGSGLGHVEATKILSQFLRDAKPDKTNPIRHPSGYMRKNLDESRRVITSTLAAPGGVPPYLTNALVQLTSWKEQNPMSPASPAVLSLTGRAAREAQALHAHEAAKGKGKGVDPAWPL